MLHELELADAELSVLLTNDACIRELNREHRGKDKPTDVLAFPLDLDGASRTPGKSGAPRLLGDVVISLDTALRQARARRRELMAEVRFLLAHGVLHLVGHDHATRAQKRVMDRWTRRLVRAASALASPPRPPGTGRRAPRGGVGSVRKSRATLRGTGRKRSA
jgi:probable rRNA maturation factor